MTILLPTPDIFCSSTFYFRSRTSVYELLNIELDWVKRRQNRFSQIVAWHHWIKPQYTWKSHFRYLFKNVISMIQRLWTNFKIGETDTFWVGIQFSSYDEQYYPFCCGHTFDSAVCHFCFLCSFGRCWRNVLFYLPYFCSIVGPESATSVLGPVLVHRLLFFSNPSLISIFILKLKIIVRFSIASY